LNPETRAIQRYSGCSVGAFFALVAYLGCDTRDVMVQRDLEEYMHYFDYRNRWPQAARVGGFSMLGDGDRVEAFLDAFIEHHTGIEDATLQQLHEHVGGRFTVFTTTLETGPMKLSHETHPYMKASTAVFVSALIPWNFEPRSVTVFGRMGDGKWVRRLHCCDGALGGNNYPVHHLQPDDRVLGVRFQRNLEKFGVCKDGLSAKGMMKRIVSLSIGSGSLRDHVPTLPQIKGEMVVHSIGHNPLNFDPAAATKRRLFRAGVDAGLRLLRELDMIPGTDDKADIDASSDEWTGTTSDDDDDEDHVDGDDRSRGDGDDSASGIHARRADAAFDGRTDGCVDRIVVDAVQTGTACTTR
jgi:predicted acylesterase/phospholipase RssA